MLRLVLFIILFTIIARTFWRIVDNIIEGAGGQPRRGRSKPSPPEAVQMVRDPVCGTFVLPGRAVSISDARGPVYFCSTTCRDKYRARTA